ncbi:hypothetical protein [Bradyrhizobium jicamae]|uniref:hypothetical protein n=1 Tax=Bradyrhizobium jicamae TaxID=280332 RepID=UPI00289B01A7|nr:hypothetical protein [Bradyrhizobium jicamae]
MDGLLFAVTPAVPNQGGGLLARQPSIARLAFGWKRNAYDAAVKAFLCMMVDRSAQRFEVAARTALVATMFDVSRTGMGVDCREVLASPEIIEPVDPGFDFELIAWLADIR